MNLVSMGIEFSLHNEADRDRLAELMGNYNIQLEVGCPEIKTKKQLRENPENTDSVEL